MILERIYEIGKEKLFTEEGKDELKYLTDVRGYDLETLKKTEWFYLPEDYDIKMELINENQDWKADVGKLKLQGHFGDNFRLAFPYRNNEGMITGFLKRATNPKGISVSTYDGKQHDEVRWDSTPGLKKDDLFGLDKVEKDEDTLLIVEGYPDAIYLQAKGIKNIVAVGQGKFSEKHLVGLKKRKIKNVIISFDNDDVGPDNTETAVKMILEKTNITPYVIDPKEYGKDKDPDEYFKANGFTALNNIINEKPVHGAQWIIVKLIEGYDKLNPINKQKAEEKVFEILLLIRDERAIAELHKELKSVFSVTLSAFKKLIKSKRDINKDKVVESLTKSPIVPFIDTKTNGRCYFNKMDDTLSMSVDEKILENILIDNGVKIPGIYPTFRVIFNPKDMSDKFDLYNKTFNLFTPTKYMLMTSNGQKIDLQVSCPRTFELLRNLIPVEGEMEHFINWLSFIFTKKDKARTAWVLKGVQGSGKNLFFDKIIKPLFGHNQCAVVDDDRLQSDFNGFMNNKLFVAFNEVANDETKTKRSVKSKIKALITDATMMVNEKHVRTYEMDNFANILFFSNEAIPLLIEQQDRRFNVIETGGPLKSVASFKKDPVKFINDLNAELEGFTQYLLNYSYNLFKVDMVLENEAKKEIKELSMNRFELFASKLKAKDWDWFDENYPKPGTDFFKKDNRAGLMTEADLKTGKVLRETVLKTYNSFNDGWVTLTKLSRQLKICGITIYRKKYDNRDDDYYYIF